jgi:hypothetical protein
VWGTEGRSQAAGSRHGRLYIVPESFANKVNLHQFSLPVLDDLFPQTTCGDVQLHDADQEINPPNRPPTFVLRILEFQRRMGGKLLRELVGASGFEPPTSWSRTRRSSLAEPRPEKSATATTVEFASKV